MNSIPSYSSEIEASKNLLLDAVLTVEKLGLEYVIIGGWCPYLRNRCSDIIHPGTKDVDILFKDGDIEHSLKPVVESFLNKGYILSAKHKFQLLRIYEIDGHNLVYNIDILHPSETKDAPEMFVDHFEFDFCENEAILSQT